MNNLTFHTHENGSFGLTCSIDLPYPLQEVFAFFSQPENLAKLTPASMGFRILSSTPLEMGAGTEITYRIRPLGIPMKWISLIETWDPPNEFTDVMRKGPFSSWQHSHRFTATETGTRVEDHVTYRVPGGAWIERLMVRKQLTSQFEYRSEKMHELFPDPGSGQ